MLRTHLLPPARTRPPPPSPRRTRVWPVGKACVAAHLENQDLRRRGSAAVSTRPVPRSCSRRARLERISVAQLLLSATGYLSLPTSYWLLAVGCLLQATGYWLLLLATLCLLLATCRSAWYLLFAVSYWLLAPPPLLTPLPTLGRVCASAGSDSFCGVLQIRAECPTPRLVSPPWRSYHPPPSQDDPPERRCEPAAVATHDLG